MDIGNPNIMEGLYVSKSVIERTVTDAAEQTPGVACVARGEKKSIFGAKSGITIMPEGDVIYLSVAIKLNADAPAIPTAEKVQAAIKSAVQNTLGLTVAKADIIIADAVTGETRE